MTEIVVSCPDPFCGHRFAVKSRLAWRRTQCPECQARGAAILAEVRDRMLHEGHEAPLPTLAAGSVVAVLEDLRSVHNVGSILRTCDAFGVGLVIMTGVTPTPDHQKIAKAALGAEQTVPWVWRASGVSAVTELGNVGVEVVALEESETASNIVESTVPRPFALVVGNEVGGVSSPILDRVARQVSIPMLGTKTSLNASVAFGVALWHLRFGGSASGS